MVEKNMIFSKYIYIYLFLCWGEEWRLGFNFVGYHDSDIHENPCFLNLDRLRLGYFVSVFLNGNYSLIFYLLQN
jgi:hypothetical protein